MLFYSSQEGTDELNCNKRLCNAKKASKYVNADGVVAAVKLLHNS